MIKCNRCTTFSKEEAEQYCAHKDCPHKDQVSEAPADVKTDENPKAPSTADAADDLTLGVQADEENVNKSLIGRIADAITGK